MSLETQIEELIQDYKSYGKDNLPEQILSS